MERKPPNIDFQKSRPEATEEKETYLMYFEQHTVAYNCPYTAASVWTCCSCTRTCPNREKAKFAC